MKDYSCDQTTEVMDRYPIAMAYVPWQKKAIVYENLEEGFCNGTVFPELYKPFTGRRCVK